MTSLADLTGDENRVDDLQGGTPERIVSELLNRLAEIESLSSDAVASIHRAIMSREQEATTGIGNGIAIPHMKDCAHVSSICAVFGRSRAGIDYGSIDGEPVHLFFLMLTPVGAANEHVQVMKKVVRLGRDKKTVRYLVETDNFDRLGAILEEIDDQAD